MDKLRFDYPVAEEVGERLAVFFRELPEEGVRAALEELIDDYTLATFGTSIMHEMREVKLPGGGQRITVQTLAEGRGVLVSAFGFRVAKETKCGKCKQYTITLDERSEEDDRGDISL